MCNISKSDMDEILRNSKNQNVRFFKQLISIKNISTFDISYIMSKLDLTENKIRFIKYALLQYDKRKDLNQTESYNEYLFEIVKNIKRLEDSNEKLLDEIMCCRDEILSFGTFVDYLIDKSINILNSMDQNKQRFVFSTIYVDN